MGYGSNAFNVQSPTACLSPARASHVVAVKVKNVEKPNFETGFSLHKFNG
jgi:hypothetical protein